MRFWTTATVFAFAAGIAGPVAATGPDVILGQLSGAGVYDEKDGIVAITVGTTSCNAGDQVLEWRALPSNRHPVITMNMYRLANGRMEQIGQSWVKHGFVALQQDLCGFGCQANDTGGGLGIGCSDPYGAATNRGPGLGSRGKINPFTGSYDGNDPDHQPAGSGIDQGLQVRKADLLVPNARYFIEGQYITPDDTAAGNGNNNVSHAEVVIEQDLSGNLTIDPAGPAAASTVRETPAIRAWPYALFALHDAAPDDGRIIVANKATRLTKTRFRYDYAVYNMNSERGVASLSVPIGSNSVTGTGFSSIAALGVPWSDEPWPVAVADGRVTWSIPGFESNPDGNAIRWGTTYNFWFEADASPTEATGELGYFKPGTGGPGFAVELLAPRS